MTKNLPVKGVGGGLVLNPLKAYIDKVEIVCKYRAKCSVLFLNGCVYRATVKRWDGWRRGGWLCRGSWNGSFPVEVGWISCSVV